MEAPAYPEPPLHLQRCVVEDVLSAQEIAQAKAAGRDLLAAAFIAQREGLREWAHANEVPWSQVSKYRGRPRYRNASRRLKGRS